MTRMNGLRTRNHSTVSVMCNTSTLNVEAISIIDRRAKSLVELGVVAFALRSTTLIDRLIDKVDGKDALELIAWIEIFFVLASVYWSNDWTGVNDLADGTVRIIAGAVKTLQKPGFVRFLYAEQCVKGRNTGRAEGSQYADKDEAD